MFVSAAGTVGMVHWSLVWLELALFTALCGVNQYLSLRSQLCDCVVCCLLYVVVFIILLPWYRCVAY